MSRVAISGERPYRPRCNAATDVPLVADLEVITPGRARVHELAKELGIDSKTVMARLNELGVFVKSASSTVEAKDVRALRERPGQGVAPAQTSPGVVTRRHKRPPLDGYIRNFIDPDDKRRWLENGLGPADGDLAAECARSGLMPEQLPLKVGGQSIVSRLRGGEPIGSVLARLREQGTP